MIGVAADYVVDFVDDGSQTWFEASNLLICGMPLLGRLGVVLKRRSRDHVIIVERKTTRLKRPIDIRETSRGTWRNIEARLWRCSHVDPWREAGRVTRVGEIRIHQGGVITTAIEPLVWQKEDQDHSNSCRAPFGRYRGLNSRCPSIDCVSGELSRRGRRRHRRVYHAAATLGGCGRPASPLGLAQRPRRIGRWRAAGNCCPRAARVFGRRG